MSQSHSLLEGSINRLFLRYLIPAVSATLVTSIYNLADTIMIGRGVGADALVALNLVLPIFPILYATGLLFGVGGGVLFSVARGAKEPHRMVAAFSAALVGTGSCAIVFWLLGSIFLRPLCSLLGATADNMDMVLQYASYLVHFAPLFVFSTFLQALVRNDHDPVRSMIAVLTGSILNIGLDYLFIFILNMGMAGGAAATVIGTGITDLLLLTHFFAKKNRLIFRADHVTLPTMKQLLTCGAPSFLIEIASGVITFSFNLQLLRYLGSQSIVIYGIIANCAIVCVSFGNGIAQTAQPLLAANFGGKLFDRVRQACRLGLITEGIVCMLLLSTAFFMPHTLISLFVEPTATLFETATPVLRLYFLAFLPLGLNLLYSTYFQSVLQPWPSLQLSLARGVILPILLVLVLPLFLGGQAIWYVIPLSELLTLLWAVFLMRRAPLPQPTETAVSY